MAKYRAPLLNNDVIHLIEQNKEPEQKLWIAVLAKAFDDAFYCTDHNAALDALRWIKHGLDFIYVCQLAGRDPNYVRKRMLDKVIDREAQILMQHRKIKVGVNNIIKLKKKGPEPGTSKPFIKKDYSWLPKYGHDYVER